MLYFRRVNATFVSSRRIMAVLLACSSVFGCASVLSQRVAGSKPDEALGATAADDSFPSAAEVGLASSQTNTKTR